MNQSPFCLYPWYHQYVRTDGSSRPCCAFDDYGLDGEELVPFIYHADYFDSEWNKNLRIQMLNHTPPKGCASCIKTSNAGAYSNKDASFDGFGLMSDISSLNLHLTDNPVILSEEVDISNICNLKCRMCDSSRSTKWIKDDKALNRGVNKLRKSNWILKNPKSIQILRFLGGEPMMHQKEITDQLKKVKDLNRLHELSIHFNSNMMHPITEELLDIMIQCRNVSINASIDGIGQLNDYIRSDGVWDTIIKNINTINDLSKNYNHFEWWPINTITVFNANKFDEIYRWVYEIYGPSHMPTVPVLAWGPEEFSIINLPDKIKKKLKDKYRSEINNETLFNDYYTSIIEYLNFERNISEDEFLRVFKKHNSILDHRRNTKFSDINPEMAEWLEV